MRDRNHALQMSSKLVDHQSPERSETVARTAVTGRRDPRRGAKQESS
jgi:hypothetical protein